MNRNLLAALLVGAALSAPSITDAEWDYPDDIPIIEPVTVGLAGEKPADIVRYLMARGVLAARISPDGLTVAFSSRVSGEPQLWVVDAAGGWPRQLTFGSGISSFRWTPDGQKLLVTRDANGNEREGYYLLSVAGTKERELLPQSDAYRAFGSYSDDGSRFIFASTERNGRDFDIYIADSVSGESRIVLEGEFGFFPREWQPGGDLIIVDETRGEDGNDVHLLNIETGVVGAIFQPEISSAYGNYAWLADGSGFFLSTDQDHEYAGLAYFSLQDGTLSFLDTPDADIGNVTLDATGRYLAWTTNEDGYSKIHATDLIENKAIETPQLPAGVYGLEFARSTSDLEIGVSGPAIPGDVYVWNLQTNKTSHTVKSNLAGLDPDSFVVPESLRYPARDGVVLQGLLYAPDATNCALAPPVVVNVHGGPTGQSRPSFRPQLQFLVNNCIAVFDVNVRGSTGFGKTYTRLDNQERRLDSVRDLVDTVAFLSLDKRLDAERIGVMGGSYGGYMVNAVLGSYPGVFDAGVSMVGVSDWVRALQEASPSLKASDRIEYGDIREERWQEFYEVNSPINNAGNINVPLLVQHGANDPRDPVAESDRIVQLIRDAGGTAKYMRYPDEGHGLSKQANRVAFYRAMAVFFEEYLKPED